MRRTLTLSLATIMAMFGLVFVATPANAATGVTIKTIASKTVNYGARTTILPNVAKSRSVKITSKTLSVKKGSKSYARAAKSVKIPSGTYTVKTTVRYKVKSHGKYGKTKTKSRTQTLKVFQRAKNCATYADFQSVEYDFDDPQMYGDSMDDVATELFNYGVRSTFSDYGDQIIEFRDYPVCGGNGSISVGFENGFAYAKSYYSY